MKKSNQNVQIFVKLCQNWHIYVNVYLNPNPCPRNKILKNKSTHAIRTGSIFAKSRLPIKQVLKVYFFWSVDTGISQTADGVSESIIQRMFLLPLAVRVIGKHKFLHHHHPTKFQLIRFSRFGGARKQTNTHTNSLTSYCFRGY